ncbi:MAG: hypothetical protein Q8P50_08620 [Bacillota bacterium]|jgi:hypothetical protein|nr:hypothetical protein [Bacillota bacterium]
MEETRKSSRQRLRECWHVLDSLSGSRVSMIVRPSVFEVEDVGKDAVTVRSSTGRMFSIPITQVRGVLQHVFASSQISLHETRVRYSKDHAEFIFGLVARLPGIRVLQCGLGLVLVLDQLQTAMPA